MGGIEKTIHQKKPLQTSETWEELKEPQIKKLKYFSSEIDFSINKMVDCHIPMETLKAVVEKFKGGNITNCFQKCANVAQDKFVLNIVKFGFGNRICQSTSVSVCTTFEFLSCGN